MATVAMMMTIMMVGAMMKVSYPFRPFLGMRRQDLKMNHGRRRPPDRVIYLLLRLQSRTSLHIFFCLLITRL